MVAKSDRPFNFFRQLAYRKMIMQTLQVCASSYLLVAKGMAKGEPYKAVAIRIKATFSVAVDLPDGRQDSLWEAKFFIILWVEEFNRSSQIIQKKLL